MDYLFAYSMRFLLQITKFVLVSRLVIFLFSFFKDAYRPSLHEAVGCFGLRFFHCLKDFIVLQLQLETTHTNTHTRTQSGCLPQ